MATRTLSSPPSILPLYARAAASLIPGSSLLPFIPGGGKDVPDVELVLGGVRVDPDRVARYAEVCGCSLREHLPPAYPHVLVFPLHMAAMADGRFPFGAVGLVHIENRIVQHRPIGFGEELEIRVRATKLQEHPRGRTFALLSEVLVAGETVWDGVSGMLRRGGGSPKHSGHASEEAELEPTAEWRLGGDLGRRYGAVSGDRNPIHIHPLLARPLGFPRAIAHGMWTKARCLAALESRLPDAFSVDVRFRKPILLPAHVVFASAQHGEQIDFSVSDAERGTPHLEGHTRPLAAVQASEGRNPA
jgi:acyl dehydratase